MKVELERYEIVEWFYDGLSGKIIPWTLENGGKSHDPSVQAFVLQRHGTVLARIPDAMVCQANSLAKWLDQQADPYEKTCLPTRVPLVRTEVVHGGENMRCPALDAALAGGTPALLEFGRGDVRLVRGAPPPQ